MAKCCGVTFCNCDDNNNDDVVDCDKCFGCEDCTCLTDICKCFGCCDCKCWDEEECCVDDDKKCNFCGCKLLCCCCCCSDESDEFNCFGWKIKCGKYSLCGLFNQISSTVGVFGTLFILCFSILLASMSIPSSEWVYLQDGSTWGLFRACSFGYCCSVESACEMNSNSAVISTTTIPSFSSVAASIVSSIATTATTTGSNSSTNTSSSLLLTRKSFSNSVGMYGTCRDSYVVGRKVTMSFMFIGIATALFTLILIGCYRRAFKAEKRVVCRRRFACYMAFLCCCSFFIAFFVFIGMAGDCPTTSAEGKCSFGAPTWFTLAIALLLIPVVITLHKGLNFNATIETAAEADSLRNAVMANNFAAQFNLQDLEHKMRYGIELEEAEEFAFVWREGYVDRERLRAIMFSRTNIYWQEQERQYRTYVWEEENAELEDLNSRFTSGLPTSTNALVSKSHESILIAEQQQQLRPTPGIEIIMEDNSLGQKDCVLVVHSVHPGGPADVADIQTDDVVLKWDGRSLDSKHAFAECLKSSQIGATVCLTIKRNTKFLDKNVCIGGTLRTKKASIARNE